MTLRVDAQRNLDRLLDVAGECFAERGLDVSVDEIARRAGLGHGTVFRRFATKDELVAAVFRKHLVQLTAEALETARDDDAWRALEHFLRTAAERYSANRAMVDGFDKCAGAAELEALMAAVEKLVRRAQREGTLRADVEAFDVMSLVPTAARYPEVVLDGLRAR